MAPSEPAGSAGPQASRPSPIYGISFRTHTRARRVGTFHIDSSKRKDREGWEAAAIFLQASLWVSEDAAEELCSLSLWSSPLNGKHCPRFPESPDTSPGSKNLLVRTAVRPNFRHSISQEGALWGKCAGIRSVKIILLKMIICPCCPESFITDSQNEVGNLQ